MEIIKNPNQKDWTNLVERSQIPSSLMGGLIKEIFEHISRNGDKGIKHYTKLFDGVEMEDFVVTAEEMESAEQQVDKKLKEAICLAEQNIRKFHKAQVVETVITETTKGVKCWTESRAIETVGIYIPGGSAPLFSTVLMLAIPAAIAGCKEIILCTPPNEQGNVNPAILFAAKLTGVSKVFKIGGVQAIAGLSVGTETVPKVYKLFGPGNQYVTAAKQYAQQLGIAIDMPAGPSELLITADETAVPEFVAADLLSQAEHGPDSQVICLLNAEELIEAVMEEVDRQLQFLPRKDIASKALKNSKIISLSSLSERIEFINSYAPEHLIIAENNARTIAKSILNAGSVFLGNYSPESAGDYASGTNHTLPTNGFAKAYSGVDVSAFQKNISFQEITRDGLEKIGEAVELMAQAEGLEAHKNAVSLRLKKERL